jgi:hypothetical protein
MSAELDLVYRHETVKTLCGWGWLVFPLAPGKKIPVTPNGHKNATNDVPTVLRLFDNGQLNIGIATGPSKLVVLDVDGESGHIWLTQAVDSYGLTPTFAARTRSGGLHYYFKAPAEIEIKCSASRIAPGIDIRATGGYVVGPTSWVDADEKGPAGWYRIIDDSPVAPLPEWLLRLILATQTRAPRNPTSRPCSLKRVQAETPRAVATLKDLLNYIDADCDYETYRSVIWAVCSTGWKCAEQIALDWSLTAEHRFEQSTFEALINSYDPDHPDAVTYGTLVYLARQGGCRV